MAFTLAEPLIVMGVIGIVAALTIPNLNSSTKNKDTVTKLKKVYAELNGAQDRAIAIYGPIEDWFKNDNCLELDGWDAGNIACKQRYLDRITESMKIRKYCQNRTEDCMMNKYGEWLYGGKQSTTNLNGYPSVIIIRVFNYQQQLQAANNFKTKRVSNYFN